MLRYIGKRLLWMIPIILGVSLLIMVLLEFCPGEPAQIILGIDATEESIAQLNHELGLDQPFVIRYVNFMLKAVRFEFGNSYTTKTPIRDAILFRIPYTLVISLASTLFSVCIGIPAGIMAATHQYSIWDNLTMFGAMFLVSMPNFWLALVLVSVFALKLGVLPSVGVETLKGWILPCVAVGVGSVAGMARQTRSSMLDVIRQDYITTARAKGQKESKVVYGHALQNALLPIITIVGGHFASALGGSMLVETIFSIPGMGSYLITAINSRDYAVIQAGAFVISVWFSFMMLLVDLLYAYVDPRLRSQFASKKKVKKETA